MRGGGWASRGCEGTWQLQRCAAQSAGWLAGWQYAASAKGVDCGPQHQSTPLGVPCFAHPPPHLPWVNPRWAQDADLFEARLQRDQAQAQASRLRARLQELFGAEAADTSYKPSEQGALAGV